MALFSTTFSPSLLLPLRRLAADWRRFRLLLLLLLPEQETEERRRKREEKKGTTVAFTHDSWRRLFLFKKMTQCMSNTLSVSDVMNYIKKPCKKFWKWINYLRHWYVFKREKGIYTFASPLFFPLSSAMSKKIVGIFKFLKDNSTVLQSWREEMEHVLLERIG